jgi:hypothetical protein
MPLPPYLPIDPDAKALLQIRARAENPSLSGKNNAFDAFIGVEQSIRAFDLVHHGCREGIVVVGAVQGEDDDRRFGGVVR